MNPPWNPKRGRCLSHSSPVSNRGFRPTYWVNNVSIGPQLGQSPEQCNTKQVRQSDGAGLHKSLRPYEGQTRDQACRGRTFGGSSGFAEVTDTIITHPNQGSLRLRSSLPRS